MIGGVKPLILKHWEASIKLDPSCLELIPVWVSLPDLDIRFWSSHMLAAMGSAIGRPILTDFHNINQSRLSYARVMIEISAKQDLLREITFRGPGNKVIQQELHYECLPNHCPVCLLCFDLVQEWIASNPAASICTPQGVSDFKEMANFQDYHGLPEFRNAVARFMGKVRGDRAKFEPDRIVMSGGATGAHELMAFCLADPGDAFLVPTPYYPGFDRDLKWRTGVQLLPIETSSSNNFRITRSALEEAFLKAEAAKIKVKGVLITNPSNPLGTILDKETLSLLLSFINQKQIHLVCDEIYSATVFSDHPYRFTSIAEMIDQNNMMKTCNLDLIHIVYSLSKDMGFPGFRVGIVYSYNDKVVSCARKMSSFGLVSSQTQHLIASMLSDDEFVETYLSESKKRLARRYKLFTLGLSQVGISSLKSNGGLFVWMDLRHLLKEPTEEAELSLWRVIINEVKLNVSPGSSFHCSEAGWFRVCFANMDDETVKVALRRIRSFMLKGYASENKANEVKKKKKKCWQMDLQLRLSAKRLEDIMGSGQVMSPHSPLPISPLVRART